MPRLIVNGKRKLAGNISVTGAKNSVLPLLAATLLIDGETVLHNCPHLSDVDISLKILEDLGCKTEFEEDTATVDASSLSCSVISDSLMREMRSSIVFLGAIASRCGCAKLSAPGGCELGPRPIDIHIDSLRKMGLEITEQNGYLDCVLKNGRFHGADITLNFPSVGATENIILASVLCDGVVTARNCAREPEIEDLCDFLCKCGAKIKGAGTPTVIIEGVNALHPTEHTVIPDRIVASTYLSAAVATGSRLCVDNIIKEHILPCIPAFEEMGCRFRFCDRSVKIFPPERPRKVEKVNTMVYPGFPTDACPPFMASACTAEGTSMFIENIFENRYKFVDELKRLGAKIKVVGKVAVIEGTPTLYGAKTRATDLRGGAALVVAALNAEGKTEIDMAGFIDRGYEHIETALSRVGADIKRVPDKVIKF